MIRVRVCFNVNPNTTRFRGKQSEGKTKEIKRNQKKSKENKGNLGQIRAKKKALKKRREKSKRIKKRSFGCESARVRRKTGNENVIENKVFYLVFIHFFFFSLKQGGVILINGRLIARASVGAEALPG